MVMGLPVRETDSGRREREGVWRVVAFVGGCFNRTLRAATMEISDIAKTPLARISRKMMVSSVAMTSFYRSRPKSGRSASLPEPRPEGRV